jgi:hypothetical protein
MLFHFQFISALTMASNRYALIDGEGASRPSWDDEYLRFRGVPINSLLKFTRISRTAVGHDNIFELNAWASMETGGYAPSRLRCLPVATPSYWVTQSTVLMW